MIRRAQEDAEEWRERKKDVSKEAERVEVKKSTNTTQPNAAYGSHHLQIGSNAIVMEHGTQTEKTVGWGGS